ncbi:ScpA family protein [Halorhabdus sp. BNX81]|uniref:segregation and condensation protein A n=1 Tax=Halorhabdus sp. BNX81 TaxID=2980181 RepID=UPI0023DD4A60|nr:ScpA family protein [Halorhabdus sp. BNX81]
MTEEELMSEDQREDTDGGEQTRPDGGTGVMAQSGAPSEPSLDDGEVEPVEVLVGLAEDDEIDPWDIDVVRVTDKFLERLDEVDLRTSGRALFYASVLLRMKSDALLEDDDPAEEPAVDEPADPFAAGDLSGGDSDPFDALEDEMDRRLDRKRARGTPDTLEDLVRELREAERSADWKESREYDTSDSPRGFRRGTQELDYRMDDDMREDAEPTVEDVTGTAHGENVEELVESVATKIETQFDAGRDAVLFAEVDGAAGSRIESFLGLLFLSNQGRIVLDQDEYFGDLWIQPPESTPAE